MVPWSEDWPKEFLLEKEKIQNKLGEFILEIYHIGSTAVEGLSAKPIIDIAVEINDFNDGEDCATSLKKIGYSYKGINILPERHYFNKGEPRTHQIHMYQTGNQFLVEQLKFRDYLRSNHNAKLEYQELKIQLSKANKHYKHKYAEAKTDFIKSVLSKL